MYEYHGQWDVWIKGSTFGVIWGVSMYGHLKDGRALLTGRFFGQGIYGLGSLL
jgi:hypothetical protein